ncbi:MAG: phenylalanine--tRNA ligase subunit beta [Bacteroidales bacterium]
MKISYNWLKSYANVELPVEEVSFLLTDCGLEVEGIQAYESIKGGLNGLVIGQVLSCEKHPDADKLSLTTVDIGSGEILSIVCGAPNVAKGQKVIVATVGTVLYHGEESFVIKKSKIRGQESLGMLCAEDEIGLGKSHDGILVLPSEIQIGTLASDYFKVEKDFVFEIGLTPNRSDATSHIGVARDLIALLRTRQNANLCLNYPKVEPFTIADQSLAIDVQVVDSQNCPRYTGISIRDVNVSDSPQWIQNRLKAVGIRPINNIVDITNFVLMETGQPLHAFDAAEVGEKVVVRPAKSGEKIRTLDGVERELQNSNLMICNATEPMCIAGVFGGEKSGVNTHTKNIFLESAYFNPVSVRKTARMHDLHTDASFRYERGCDPQITNYALKRAALLICEIAGGTIASNIVDIYPTPIEGKLVSIDFAHIDRLIGKAIGADEICRILSNLEIEIVSKDTNTCMVRIPTNKADVYREADMIEEILRIYGYNNIELTGHLSYALNYAAKPNPEKVQNEIADLLTHNGFAEIMNNSLTKSEYAEKCLAIQAENIVFLTNPLSRELNCMRSSLLGGGMESIAYNCNHKICDIKVYEFGRVYKKNQVENTQNSVSKRYAENFRLGIFMSGNKGTETWEQARQKVDFYTLKSFVHAIMSTLRLDSLKLSSEIIADHIFSEGIAYSANDKCFVRFGKVKNSVCKYFDCKQEVFFADFDWDLVFKLMPKKTIEYKEISKFPGVRRDLALLLDQNISFEVLKKIAFQCEKSLLKSVNLFDVYQGDKLAEGKKSYALSFVLQDEGKTLTDKQIEKVMEKLQKAFVEQAGASLR